MKPKALSLLLALLLALTACGGRSAAADTPSPAPVNGVETAALAGPMDGFSDVPAGADYAQAVDWCREKGVLNGVGEGRFDPEGTLTRAMLVTALYRADGEPAAGGAPAFTDTGHNAWYSNAVAWAAETGLVEGYGDGLFGPDDPVSVEQLEVILGRYLGDGPAWTGDPGKAHAATRAQVAVALYNALKDREENAMKQITLSFNGYTYTATLADNSSAEAFAQLLESKGGAMTVHMSEYGGWEKVGDLGQTLPSSDSQTTTAPGDFVLYQSDSVVLFYGSNSWSYTRLGRIDDPSGLREALGDGDVELTFQLTSGT